MELAAAAGIGFLLDLWIGDPEEWWHPVRGMGWLIGRLEGLLRQSFPKSPAGEMAAGGVMAVLVMAASGGIAVGILEASGRIHPALRFFVMCVMNWQLLAAKALKTESMKVYDALRDGDVEQARWAVSRIVGRDTKPLSEEGIMKAAVETVAENTSDGVIAPLFYLFILGPAGGFVYKAVNTMDSMTGYRNEQYLYFGRIPARLDDVVNLIPARLAAFFLIGAAWVMPGFDRGMENLPPGPVLPQKPQLCPGGGGVRRSPGGGAGRTCLVFRRAAGKAVYRKPDKAGGSSRYQAGQQADDGQCMDGTGCRGNPSLPALKQYSRKKSCGLSISYFGTVPHISGLAANAWPCKRRLHCLQPECSRQTGP